MDSRCPLVGAVIRCADHVSFKQLDAFPAAIQPLCANEAEAEVQVVNNQLQREWANAQQRHRTAVEQVNKYRERILPKANEASKVGEGWVTLWSDCCWNPTT